MSHLAIQYVNKLASLVLGKNVPALRHEEFWQEAVEKLENLGRGNGEHSHYHLHVNHSLSKETEQFVKSLAEAYQHNIGEKMNHIIMTQAELVEQLKGVATTQKKTIEEIKTVQGTVTTLNEKVADLNAIIAQGGPITPELEAAAKEVTDLAGLTDEQIPDEPAPVVVP